MTTEIPLAWTKFIESIDSSAQKRLLVSFAVLAAKDDVLSELYPHTSHGALGLSRTKTYPFSGNLPFVRARHGGLFDIVTENGKCLFSGTAAETVKAIKALSIQEEATGHVPLKSRCNADYEPTLTCLAPASDASYYISLWAQLEKRTRDLYICKSTYVSQQCLVRATLNFEKGGRLKVLKKLRDDLVHGEFAAIQKVTPARIVEVINLLRIVQSRPPRKLSKRPLRATARARSKVVRRA